MEDIERCVERVVQEARVSFAVTATVSDPVEDGVFSRPIPPAGNYFSVAQRAAIDAVLMQLFSDDGDGPSARDLNAVAYLEWAMTDPVNLEDGDPRYLARGIDRLNEHSRSTYGADFVELSAVVQNDALRGIAESTDGENWLSLMIFYLTEALMLDPYYGGNPDMVGWLWLGHRPGFPRPVDGKSYRDFE